MRSERKIHAVNRPGKTLLWEETCRDSEDSKSRVNLKESVSEMCRRAKHKKHGKNGGVLL